MIITRNGVVNRQRVSEIRTIGRATQGVRLVNLDEGDQVMDVARVVQENGIDEEAGPGGEGDVSTRAPSVGVEEMVTEPTVGKEPVNLDEAAKDEPPEA